MPSPTADYIPLPSDSRDLTRDLVLRFCTHPEVLVQEFARLAHSQPNPVPPLTPKRVQHGR